MQKYWTGSLQNYNQRYRGRLKKKKKVCVRLSIWKVNYARQLIKFDFFGEDDDFSKQSKCHRFNLWTAVGLPLWQYERKVALAAD